MNITLERLGETAILRPCDAFYRGCARRATVAGEGVFGPEGEPRCLCFRSREDARTYLRRFTGRPDVVRQLRAILGQESFSVGRLADHEVVDQCAARLAQRRLCVVLAEAAVASTHQATGIARRDVVRAAPPPSRPAAPRPAAGRPQAVAQPPAQADPLARIDHDAQAAVLVRAARDGVPFCEECEKAGRQPAEVAEVPQ